MDLYIAKFYGYGLAKDKNAFFVADVSTVDGATVATLEAHANNTGNNADSIIVKTTQNPGVQIDDFKDYFNDEIVFYY